MSLSRSYTESRQHLEKWSEHMAHELGLDVIRDHLRVVLARLDELETAATELLEIRDAVAPEFGIGYPEHWLPLRKAVAALKGNYEHKGEK